ncbi:STAS domain-containing protein [Polynucleobacter sp. MWH-Svant-W18]|uniref:STAS domain-containing protein n=1 Tax=Polynucleobacter sp. MWH-Svant-W18 TaxID=1855909 RepID=UPI001BFE1BAF|nr:STAS domain-containing protein [Polynucleobacter sp. MWH-Svant-W18]QWD77225.1 STAS domain-containing protein [Polynucleobacter sp. MWH-Svant-W18]
MPIDFKDTEAYRLILIDGRLDSAGSDEIATRFAAMSSGAKPFVMVDLSQVSFLSSIGIRLVIQNAKSLQGKGGKMVLITGDNEHVSGTLESTGISTLVPLFTSLELAEAAFTG